MSQQATHAMRRERRHASGCSLLLHDSHAAHVRACMLTLSVAPAEALLVNGILCSSCAAMERTSKREGSCLSMLSASITTEAVASAGTTEAFRRRACTSA